MKKITRVLILVLILMPSILIFSACNTSDINDNFDLLNITSVTLSNANYIYDGEEKQVLISGELPEGVNVVYINNTATNAGSYSVTATISGEGYNTLNLSATLVIQQAPINTANLSFSDLTTTYDGNNHIIELLGTLPFGVTVSYSKNGLIGNSAVEPGTYEIIATITGSNYQTVQLTATLKINPNLANVALAILDNIIQTPDPWEFLPETMSLENRIYNGNILNYSNFVDVSNIPQVGMGKQMNVVYDLLINAQAGLSYLNSFYQYTDLIVDLYQTFINNNPDNYANYEHSTDNFDFKITLADATSLLFVRYGSVALELSYDEETSYAYGRIQLSDSNVLKYEMSENSLQLAVNISNVVLAQVEFIRNETNTLGYVYEFVGASDTYIKTSAMIEVNEDYTTIIGSKGDFVVPTQGRVVEVYDNNTGRYIGSEVQETVSSIKYDTFWYNLYNIEGIYNIKRIDESNGLNADTIYINDSANSFVAKRSNFGLGSRNYDIEFKTMYFYQYNTETEKYEKVSLEIPQFFVQKNYLSTYKTVAYTENDESGLTTPLNNTLSTLAQTKIENGYTILLPVYETIRETFSYENIIAYLGSINEYFNN